MHTLHCCLVVPVDDVNDVVTGDQFIDEKLICSSFIRVDARQHLGWSEHTAILRDRKLDNLLKAEKTKETNAAVTRPEM